MTLCCVCVCVSVGVYVCVSPLIKRLLNECDGCRIYRTDLCLVSTNIYLMSTHTLGFELCVCVSVSVYVYIVTATW